MNICVALKGCVATFFAEQARNTGPIFVFFLSFFFVSSPIWASDLVVSPVRVGAMDAKTGTIAVSFDVSWDHSWRGLRYESSRQENWDAVWLFCKFSKRNADRVGWGPWQHGILARTGHVVPAGVFLDLGKTADAVQGVFVYSDQPKPLGRAEYPGITLQWQAREQGVAAGDLFQVQVFAIEMVYIPEGDFQIGDPKISQDPTTGTPGAFHLSGCENALRNCAYKVSGEGAMDVGDIEGYLSYSGPGDKGTPLPQEFPKGHAPFYMMKYELSQGQYRDFLNTLTRDQQKGQLGDPLPAPGQFVFSKTESVGIYRNTIRRALQDYDDGKKPLRFGCDATGGKAPDGVFDQPDDGEWVAMNYMGLTQMLSYASWAALRPVTELEYEKAARGTEDAVHMEYAWGSKINNVGSVKNKNTQAPFQADEYSNCCYVDGFVGGCNYGGALSNAPYRVGSFLSQNQTSSNRRFDAGAGFYGAQDLSGNVFEPAISVGTAASRGFRGVSGGGSLNFPADWPRSSDDIILRGGSFLENNSFVATRQYLLADKLSQLYKVGLRLGRSLVSAP